MITFHSPNTIAQWEKCFRSALQKVSSRSCSFCVQFSIMSDVCAQNKLDAILIKTALSVQAKKLLPILSSNSFWLNMIHLPHLDNGQQHPGLQCIFDNTVHDVQMVPVGISYQAQEEPQLIGGLKLSTMLLHQMLQRE